MSHPHQPSVRRAPRGLRALAPLRSSLPTITRRLGVPGDRGEEAAAQSDESLTRYEHMLETEASIAEVPVDLLKAICWFASGWRQFEPGGRPLVTPTPHGTAYGCMQLNDIWHPDAFPAAVSDAQANIRYAANLLRWIYEQTADWDRATVTFFGHDRRAELAARRVRGYRMHRPWERRLRPAAASDSVARGQRHA